MRDYVAEPIRATVTINAPLDRVWALSTDISVVARTLGLNLARTEGIAGDRIRAGSRVVWRGWKFGLPTTHHTLITAFEPPRDRYARFDGTEILRQAHFQDMQERGRFAFFQHDHFFDEEIDGGACTVLRDEVRFRLPFGAVGRLVAQVVLAPHIARLVNERFRLLKRLAEAGEPGTRAAASETA